jgi:exodeoxyribonuclease VIII
MELEIIQPQKIKKVDYYDHPAMSQSKLKEFKKSPKHYFAKYVQKQTIETTDAMKFGNIFHTLLLEPLKFAERYILMPSLDKRTKEYKEWEKNNILNEKDKEKIITFAEYNSAKQMVEALKPKKVIKELFNLGGLIEQDFFWVGSGVECKMKLDMFIEPCEQVPNGAIFDYKSTNDALPDAFSNSIYKYGYYNQVAFYRNGIKTIYNTNDYPDFYFVAIEKEAPFESAIYEADDIIMDIGLNENKKLLKMYKECLESNHFYGYDETIKKISLPQWFINKIYFKGE